MNNNLKSKLFHFMLSSGVTAVIGVISIPILTYKLELEDFALFALIGSFSELILAISSLGSSYVLYDNASENDSKKFGSILCSLTISSSICAVFLGFIFLALYGVAQTYFSIIADLPITLLLIVYIDLIIKSFLIHSGNLAKLGFGSKGFLWITITRSFTTLISVTVLIYLFKFYGEALFIGQLIASFAAAIVYILFYKKWYHPVFNWQSIKQSLHYALWVTPAYASERLQIVIERNLITYFTGLTFLGIFNHARMYQSYGKLLITPVLSATMNECRQAILKNPPSFFGVIKVNKIVSIIIFSISIAFIWLGKDVISLLTHGKFNQAHPYACLLLILLILEYSGRTQYNYMLTQKKGRKLSIYQAFSTWLGIATLPVLLGYWGLTGAIASLFIQNISLRLCYEFSRLKSSIVPFGDTTSLVLVGYLSLNFVIQYNFTLAMEVRVLISLLSWAPIIFFERFLLKDIYIFIRGLK